MLIRKVLDIVLIFTLALQMFPTTLSGRFLLLDIAEEETIELSEPGNNPLKQLDEHPHKEIHLEMLALQLPVRNCSNDIFHFDERLPEPHPGSIPTPPPNFFC